MFFKSILELRVHESLDMLLQLEATEFKIQGGHQVSAKYRRLDSREAKIQTCVLLKIQTSTDEVARDLHIDEKEIFHAIVKDELQ